MSGEKILQGVPKAHYGAFGGITPFPVCLKAVSDYLGDELDYAYAIVACGGAFRFAWNTTEWDGGNVDIMRTYDNPELPLRYGVTALGRDFKMIWRENERGYPGNATKEEYKAFIKEQIDAGKPVISLGPIGPGEAGILTGYKDDGDTLLGWSVFQQWYPLELHEEGYFITDQYWGKNDFHGVMALGDITAPRWGVKEIIAHGIAALEGRQEDNHAKGIFAYDAWKKAILNAGKSDFAQRSWGQSLVMMCQGDATDCLIDGRKNACKYFTALAEENPDQPLYAEIAAQFGIVAKTIHEKIYKLLRGYQRGKKQERALKKPRVRRKIGEAIDVMKASDEKALALMKELLGAL
ncbi:MAG: RNA polymerase subunit sigma-24 [Oscillospiraceae bacterium]|nr:RNA polymerase subunit sigma-24 [Oscillospiraceae bacterium]